MSSQKIYSVNRRYICISWHDLDIWLDNLVRCPLETQRQNQHRETLRLSQTKNIATRNEPLEKVDKEATEEICPLFFSTLPAFLLSPNCYFGGEIDPTQINEIYNKSNNIQLKERASLMASLFHDQNLSWGACKTRDIRI